jgi:hypothetical protein
MIPDKKRLLLTFSEVLQQPFFIVCLEDGASSPQSLLATAF